MQPEGEAPEQGQGARCLGQAPVDLGEAQWGFTVAIVGVTEPLPIHTL